MANRTKRGQALHDKVVAKWADKLRGPGKQVLVDLPGQKRPPKVGGDIPDVVMKQRGRIKVIGEVETLATVQSDKEQQNTFREAARRLGAEFKLKIAKEKRS